MEGIPLYQAITSTRVVSVYDNTSGEDQDSMAVMYLYVLDREFKQAGRPPRPDGFALGSGS